MIDLNSIQHFTAVDLELANDDWHSICEIGITKFRAGELVETWRALVNPECEYRELHHSDLHGIRKLHTAEASKFPDVHGVLDRFLDDEHCIINADNHNPVVR